MNCTKVQTAIICGDLTFAHLLLSANPITRCSSVKKCSMTSRSSFTWWWGIEIREGCELRRALLTFNKPILPSFWCDCPLCLLSTFTCPATRGATWRWLSDSWVTAVLILVTSSPPVADAEWSGCCESCVTVFFRLKKNILERVFWRVLMCVSTMHRHNQ